LHSLGDDDLREQLKSAMKAGEALRLQVIRSLLTGLKNRSIEKKGEPLDDKDRLAVARREAKQAAESLEFAERSGREDIIAKARNLLSVCNEFLPSQMNEAELTEAVRGILSEGDASSLGDVMKALAARYAGRYDGKAASAIARELLEQAR